MPFLLRPHDRVVDVSRAKAERMTIGGANILTTNAAERDALADDLSHLTAACWDAPTTTARRSARS